MPKYQRLWDAYRFPGFLPQHTVSGIFGDPKSRVIGLRRRGKKRFAVSVAVFKKAFTTGKSVGFGIFPVETCASTWMWKSGACLAEFAIW
jgi:hypothetical protein